MPEMTVWPVSSSELDPEGRVLLGQREQGPGQLVLVGLGLGLDGHVDHRLGEGRAPRARSGRRGSHRVSPGGGLLEADRGHDVAGEDGVLVLAVVGVHLQDAADPLLACPWWSWRRTALGQRARVDPQVGELADEGVGHDLEGQGREGVAVVGLALLDVLGVVRLVPLGGREVERAGQVVDDGVEHGLDALVLEGRPAQDGDHWRPSVAVRRARRRSSAVIGSSARYFSMMVSSKLETTSISWWRASSASLAMASGMSRVSHSSPMSVGPDQGLLLEQVDDALELGLGADGQLDRRPAVASRRSRIICDACARSRRRCGPSC